MGTIAPVYQIILRDQLYNIVAIFDNVLSCEYTNEVNAVGALTISLQMSDPRVDLFQLDGIVQVKRSIPGIALPWYQDFIGLYRAPRFDITSDGKSIFTAICLGLNDMLFRAIVNYKEGTVKAYKNAPAETVLKQYAEENCGATALWIVPYEREIDHVMPDFTVEVDAGLGLTWEGDKAFENLLDTLREVASITAVDFDTVWDEATKKFIFKTYVNQLGTDRTTIGLDRTTGLNGAGNTPIVFSLEYGNVKSMTYDYERESESNVVTVLGEGDGATRLTVVRGALATMSSSPWNRREVARPENGFISQMEFAGDVALDELSAKEVITFEPLLQPTCMYGQDYFLGDRVTAIFRGQEKHKRILKISNNISIRDSITITFSDL